MGITFYGPPKETHEPHESQESHTEESEEHEESEEEHHDDHHSDPHDPGPAMMVPLYLLAAFTIIAFVVFPFIQNIVLESSQSWAEIMNEMILVKLTMPGVVPFAITLFALAIGGVPGYIIYIRNADRKNTIIPETGFRRRIHNFLKHRWYINEFYYWVLNKFLNAAEWYRVRVDNNIIDGIDFKSADSAKAISGRARWFDDSVVDGFAEGISTQSVAGSERGQRAQTGVVNDYVGVIMFGIGLLVIIALITMGVI